MSESAVQLAASRTLRVAVNVPDPIRRRELERLVSAAGHGLAVLDTADIVISVERVSDATSTYSVTLRTMEFDRAAVLPDDARPEQIDAALRAVAVGLVVRAGAAHDGGFEPARRGRIHPLLTPRELEILTAISDGASNKAIARQLAISQHTVKFHVESLFRKLNVRTRAEAVAKGLERRNDEQVQL